MWLSTACGAGLTHAGGVGGKRVGEHTLCQVAIALVGAILSRTHNPSMGI